VSRPVDLAGVDEYVRVGVGGGGDISLSHTLSDPRPVDPLPVQERDPAVAKVMGRELWDARGHARPLDGHSKTCVCDPFEQGRIRVVGIRRPNEVCQHID
jgi:hypothetical protein